MPVVAARELLAEEHGQGVHLFTGRARGHPDTNGCIAWSPRHQRRDDVSSKAVPGVGVPEEGRHGDGAPPYHRERHSEGESSRPALLDPASPLGVPIDLDP